MQGHACRNKMMLVPMSFDIMVALLDLLLNHYGTNMQFLFHCHLDNYVKCLKLFAHVYKKLVALMLLLRLASTSIVRKVTSYKYPK